ncbi:MULTISPECIES: BglG family transcription antiterminator [unclassified Enterococcus]|uniref:BglG family transcription antiterminator n=1 Tax=unclassified Enterococcus TaxID=2608891 RepID=UPI0013EB040B|nr:MULTISPECIES: BglG family transcription antiterminator [unclassified Enterococcus]
MYLSPREKQLLTELINSPSPVSIKRMMNLLKVSRRTVYRELDNLELSLKSEGAHLQKVGRGAFVINATEEIRKKLQEEGQEKSEELSTAQRQHAILAELLLTDDPLSLTYFLEKYLISNTTFYADIKQLEASISQLPLEIIRNRGYEVTGPEKYRRLLVANVLELEINEYEIFHHSESDPSSNYFFRFVATQHLALAQKVVGEELVQQKTDLSDRKLEHLVLMLAITMDRVTNNHLLTNETYTGLVNKDLLGTAKQLFSKIGAETKQLYPVNEIVFFASLLNDFSNSFDQNFFEETFDTQLAYLVKKLIQEVSDETNVHFYEDETLYKMLLTHLSGVFSRAVLQEEVLSNPILEKIMVQYEEIAQALRHAVGHIFQEKKLSEEEIAYMVLHFANSLEKSPKESTISIAGFSPSGLASTSMLEMRLKRYFPFIQQIHFYRIADLKKIDLQDNYDLVISTSILPGYDGKYILVSPLLLEDEVKQLREEFSHITKKHRHAKENEKPASLIEDTYEQTMSVMDRINILLSSFFIQTIDNPSTISETIDGLFAYFPEVINDQSVVRYKLMKRYKQAPIGIPHTNMGLFHTSSSAVSKPIFCIFNLKNALKIESMDKQTIDLSRMLVMLAPSPIDETDKKLLGKISGAIIMNDLNTEIFRSGNKEIVYQLLAKILIEEIKK